MDGESLRYDRALAAGRLIYEKLVPAAAKPDARILAQVVFTIIEAMEEAELRRESAAEPPGLRMDDGEKPEARWQAKIRFFCPKCLRRYRVSAAHKNTFCLCPACGASMRTPDVTGRN